MSIYTVLLQRQGKSKEAELLCEKMLLHYLNQSTAMLTTLAKISKESEDYHQSLIYLDAICKIEGKFQIGLYSGAYNTCKLYIKRRELELAAKWFKTYVDGLISIGYDYSNNQFFKEVQLEVNVNGQKIVRKKLFQSLIDEYDLKVLVGLSDYDEAIERLKDNL